MKILVITRGNEIRHIDSILKRLHMDKHEVLIMYGNVLHLPWWYKLVLQIEEYKFYHMTLVHQADFLKRRIFNGYNPWFKKTIKYFPNLSFLKKFYNPPIEIMHELKQINPDMVIATSLMLIPVFEDHAFALAALRLKISLISFVPTWDSLTTKTKIYPVPDIMFCWNEWMKSHLIQYHGIEESTIRVVGCYTFEKFLKPYKVQRRDKFCARYGFNPRKPIITYLCSSPSIVSDESGPILQFINQMAGRQIIVRPHPDNPLKRPELPQNVRISSTDQYDVYYHSAALYGVNTSAMIEAMILGKPVFALETGNAEVQRSIHFKELEDYFEGTGYKYIKSWLGLQKELPSELAVKEIYGIKTRNSQKPWHSL